MTLKHQLRMDNGETLHQKKRLRTKNNEIYKKFKKDSFRLPIARKIRLCYFRLKFPPTLRVNFCLKFRPCKVLLKTEFVEIVHLL